MSNKRVEIPHHVFRQDNRKPVSGEYISLGAGIQSSTLTLKWLHKEIKGDLAGIVFADTMSETESTYRQVQFLADIAADHDIPLYTVTNGDLRETLLDPNVTDYSIPFYTTNEKTGKKAMISRHCTQQFKILPVRLKIQKLTGANSKHPVRISIGFSIDEALRMSAPKVQYVINRYPLIEQRMSKDNCVAWLDKHGYPIPEKSACTFCPFRSDDTWKLLTINEFEKVVDFEEKMNKQGLTTRSRKTGKLKGKLRLHSSMIPIKERPFDNPNQTELDLTTEDCSGGCWT